VKRSIALVALAGAGVMATSASGIIAGADAATSPKPPKPKVVKIDDNYFSPAVVTAVPNQKVTWKWPTDIGDTHDVTATKVPRGVKKFHSAPYAVGSKYSQTFTKPGTYSLVCTFHPTEMTMTVIVKKK
jgi:plastocyanin